MLRREFPKLSQLRNPTRETVGSGKKGQTQRRFASGHELQIASADCLDFAFDALLPSSVSRKTNTEQPVHAAGFGRSKRLNPIHWNPGRVQFCNPLLPGAVRKTSVEAVRGDRLRHHLEVKRRDHAQPTEAADLHATEVISGDVLDDFASSVDALAVAVEVLDADDTIPEAAHVETVRAVVVAGKRRADSGFCKPRIDGQHHPLFGEQRLQRSHRHARLDPDHHVIRIKEVGARQLCGRENFRSGDLISPL